LAPNPALPKDQPLRGRWCNACVFSSDSAQLHTNSYEVVSVIPTFVLLCSRISHTNSYEVVSVIPTFVLLHLRIGYTNSYAVDGVIPSFIGQPQG